MSRPDRRAVPTATGMEKEMRTLYIEGIAITVAPSHALAFREGAAKR